MQSKSVLQRLQKFKVNVVRDVNLFLIIKELITIRLLKILESNSF